MARKKKNENKQQIESYEHRDKQRANNPPVGLVTPETDSEPGWGKGV
jgi:adenine-specific DNA-methyltransferase